MSHAGTTEQLRFLPVTGERVLLILDGAAFQAIPLPDTGTLSIGRSSKCDISIDAPDVSRHHADLIVDEEVDLQDLGSSNGTYVAGQLLASQQRQRVAVGMPFAVGAVTLMIQIRSSAATAEAPSTGKFAQLEEAAERMADSALGILLAGETGAGKSYFAERIHQLSSRAAGPFVRIPCGAVVDTQLEIELFGTAAAPGLLERAEGGTAFLDGVTELPGALQLKLVRVLETRTIRRIGSIVPKRLDVRFISATSKEILVETESRRFRTDLYFRLAGATFVVPPLRERRDELLALAERFVAEASGPSGRARMLGAEARTWIQQYNWPGNVRELRNACERAVLLASGSLLERRHFTLEASEDVAAPEPQEPTSRQPLRISISELERVRIMDALKRCSGNQTKAAELLGIARRTLINRLDEYGVVRPRKQ